jgi:biotin transport system permease protein
VIGTYVPGHSPLHRAPVAAKLIGLLLAGALIVWLRQPWQVGVALVVAVAGYRLAGLGWLVLLRQIRPLWPLLLVTAVLHLLLSDWRRSVVVVGGIVVLVLLAALVTLTTRTTDLIDVVIAAAHPLRRLGVDTERLGLMIALGIRCVPVMVALAGEVRDAQQARGLTASPRAFAVPLLVRALRRADALAEALVARGVDD